MWDRIRFEHFSDVVPSGSEVDGSHAVGDGSGQQATRFLHKILQEFCSVIANEIQVQIKFREHVVLAQRYYEFPQRLAVAINRRRLR